MTDLLNKNWTMYREGSDEKLSCDVPCSVYKTLIDNVKIPDPYYRENEYISTQICDDDYTFAKSFDVSADLLAKNNISLVFEGIDTLADIYFNGTKIGSADNMHRIWKYNIKALLKEKSNLLEVKIKSPDKYVTEKYQNRKLWGVDTTMEGYPYLRKAHCMFGWDWGPKLPDMGIWRDVKIIGFNDGKIEDVYYTQQHNSDNVVLTADIHTDNYNCEKAKWEIFDPRGKLIAEKEIPVSKGNTHTAASVKIEDPQLWWANGYGEQNLYKSKISLISDESDLEQDIQKIGLRTLTISQDSDQWGEEFCFKLNGRKVFAMGGNYIPEDQIVTRCSKERTYDLLNQCIKANFNFIRVWGGGYYPDDYFYDFCDEHGLIVWQDFMFACSAYLMTDEFAATVKEEIKDNIIRLRNHPSLGLWCGNNEIESAWEYWGLPEDEQAKSDYFRLFEDMIPSLIKEFSPQTFYWPSSPSSGGGMKDSSSNHAGDMHYWDVWHNFKPIEDFRQTHYRFCSEYGFESLPSVKTISTFADESRGDFDLMSPVMQAHQKCVEGNEKVMFYLAQMVRYPYTFEQLIYSSQLVQADCIRSNVEHMRRSRGRCMGSAYWQINDSNPIISWSSIDYYGRWKGLHYYAARFYAPVLLSVEDKDPLRPIFNISNETMEDFDGEIVWTLRNNKAEILERGVISAKCSALSAADIEQIDISKHLKTTADKRKKYLEYKLISNEKIISKSTTLFVRPKEFTFLEPQITYRIKEYEDRFAISFSAKNYAKSVCIDLKDNDAVFSDNWFDIHGSEPIEIILKKSDLTKQVNKAELDHQLTVMHN